MQGEFASFQFPVIQFRTAPACQYHLPGIEIPAHVNREKFAAVQGTRRAKCSAGNILEAARVITGEMQMTTRLVAGPEAFAALGFKEEGVHD